MNNIWNGNKVRKNTYVSGPLPLRDSDIQVVSEHHSLHLTLTYGYSPSESQCSHYRITRDGQTEEDISCSEGTIDYTGLALDTAYTFTITVVSITPRMEGSSQPLTVTYRTCEYNY